VHAVTARWQAAVHAARAADARRHRALALRLLDAAQLDLLAETGQERAHPAWSRATIACATATGTASLGVRRSVAAAARQLAQDRNGLRPAHAVAHQIDRPPPSALEASGARRRHAAALPRPSTHPCRATVAPERWPRARPRSATRALGRADRVGLYPAAERSPAPCGSSGISSPCAAPSLSAAPSARRQAARRLRPPGGRASRSPRYRGGLSAALCRLPDRAPPRAPLAVGRCVHALARACSCAPTSSRSILRARGAAVARVELPIALPGPPRRGDAARRARLRSRSSRASAPRGRPAERPAAWPRLARARDDERARSARGAAANTRVSAEGPCRTPASATRAPARCHAAGHPPAPRPRPRAPAERRAGRAAPLARARARRCRRFPAGARRPTARRLYLQRTCFAAPGPHEGLAPDATGPVHVAAAAIGLARVLEVIDAPRDSTPYFRGWWPDIVGLRARARSASPSGSERGHRRRRRSSLRLGYHLRRSPALLPANRLASTRFPCHDERRDCPRAFDIDLCWISAATT
jgi:hypothetical protein